MSTTKIRVAATDNELYVLAATPDGSYELCHLKSGYSDTVDYAVTPQSILPTGKYMLILIGINWGGPQAFNVVLTTDGIDTSYLAPASSAIGANWTVSVPITV
jgi:hypothetical protein